MLNKYKRNRNTLNILIVKAKNQIYYMKIITLNKISKKFGNILIKLQIVINEDIEKKDL